MFSLAHILDFWSRCKTIFYVYFFPFHPSNTLQTRTVKSLGRLVTMLNRIFLAQFVLFAHCCRRLEFVDHHHPLDGQQLYEWGYDSSGVFSSFEEKEEEKYRKKQRRRRRVTSFYVLIYSGCLSKGQVRDYEGGFVFKIFRNLFWWRKNFLSFFCGYSLFSSFFEKNWSQNFMKIKKFNCTVSW